MKKYSSKHSAFINPRALIGFVLLFMGALLALFAFGWTLVLVSTFLINHFDLFGLRQVWLFLRGKPYTPLTFGTPGPYRLVRHPLYVGWFFAFWMTPTMTYAHLLFAVATAGYILIAIQFEERDLVHFHGRTYEEYRQRVPMLIPFVRRSASSRQKLQRAGAAVVALMLVKGLVWLAIGAAVLRK